MPSDRPITNIGWGVRPPYSRTTEISSSPAVAMPQRVRGNSRSPRSQIAYAANSRSRSRNSRRSTRSTVLRASTPGREPIAAVAISPRPPRAWRRTRRRAASGTRRAARRSWEPRRSRSPPGRGRVGRRPGGVARVGGRGRVGELGGLGLRGRGALGEQRRVPGCGRPPRRRGLDRRRQRGPERRPEHALLGDDGADLGRGHPVLERVADLGAIGRDPGAGRRAGPASGGRPRAWPRSRPPARRRPRWSWRRRRTARPRPPRRARAGRRPPARSRRRSPRRGRPPRARCRPRRRRSAPVPPRP